MSTEANAPAATDEGGRGRPRPQDVIARDEKAYQTLIESGPLTKPDLAEKLGITPSLTYMSLFRLAQAGRVRRVATESARSHTWEAVQDTPTV